MRGFWGQQRRTRVIALLMIKIKELVKLQYTLDQKFNDKTYPTLVL